MLRANRPLFAGTNLASGTGDPLFSSGFAESRDGRVAVRSRIAAAAAAVLRGGGCFKTHALLC